MDRVLVLLGIVALVGCWGRRWNSVTSCASRGGARHDEARAQGRAEEASRREEVEVEVQQEERRRKEKRKRREEKRVVRRRLCCWLQDGC